MTSLRIDSLTAGYGRITVLRDVSLTVETGEIVSVVGPNGAGKTTLMRAVMGLTEIDAGSISLDGEDITDSSTSTRVERGLVIVSEDRNLFRSMTVRENLLMGSYLNREERERNLSDVLDLFPRLGEREEQRAGTLSGGEAQMLAIARALMADPEVLLLDEPSLGLAPNIIPEVFDSIDRINDDGVSVVLVEQRAEDALKLADTGCLIENGRIDTRGPAEELRSDSAFADKYLGGSA